MTRKGIRVTKRELSEILVFVDSSLVPKSVLVSLICFLSGMDLFFFFDSVPVDLIPGVSTSIVEHLFSSKGKRIRGVGLVTDYWENPNADL